MRSTVVVFIVIYHLASYMHALIIASHSLFNLLLLHQRLWPTFTHLIPRMLLYLNQFVGRL